MTDRTPEAIALALTDLLKSDGWEILQALVDARFGDAAQLSEIDAAMAGLQPSDTVGQVAIVTQIRAASKAAAVIMSLPAERLRAVKGADKKPAFVDKFKPLRRGPSTYDR